MERKGGIEAVKRSAFPWPSDPEKPPKLCVYFEQDGVIEYLLDKAAAKLPPGKSFEVLPVSDVHSA